MFIAVLGEAHAFPVTAPWLNAISRCRLAMPSKDLLRNKVDKFGAEFFSSGKAAGSVDTCSINSQGSMTEKRQAKCQGYCVTSPNIMNDIKFSASMMCADYGHLENEVHALETAGVDAFHIDILDGHFVHNFGMGIHDLRYIRGATRKSVEVHAMITEPRAYIDLFERCGVDVLYVHPESEYQCSTTLEKIINAGITPGVAINPGTSVETILELLHVAKRVLVMSVNPGQAGQVLLPHIGSKIEKLLKLQDDYDFELYWDGHGSVENVRKYAPLGLSGFVLGTAALFNKNRPYKDIIAELRKCAV
jgi:ribulose-phosphate 3-epimerase